MKKPVFLLCALTLLGCASSPPAKTSLRDPANEGAGTFKLVRAVRTSSWSTTDCEGRKSDKSCGSVYTSLAYDDSGELRLIVTSLVISRPGKRIPSVTTAFVVRNGNTVSNYGQQFPLEPAKLINAVDFLHADGDGGCPVTIHVSPSNQVIKTETACNDARET